MTDNTVKTYQEPQAAQTDWFLQTLVRMINNFDMEIGMTLQVSGMLVSGSLVSGKKYFDGFATDFSSPFSESPETAASIRSSFASYGEVYAKDEENGEDQPLPQYIHLKQARFFNTSGNPIPGNTGVWWRGRIGEVGGFSLGSLSASTGS
jgi:hypothetical protein